MSVRQLPPRRNRVHLEARPTAGEYLTIRHAAKVRGVSISKFVIIACLEYAERILAENPDCELPLELRDDLDSPIAGEY